MKITASATLLGLYREKGLASATSLDSASVIGELITLTKNIGYIAVEDFETKTETGFEQITSSLASQIVRYCRAPEQSYKLVTSTREYGFKFSGKKAPPTLQDEINFLVNNFQNTNPKDLKVLTEFIINQWSTN